MLKYQIIPVTAFQQNCTVIWCDKSGEAAIVDPGGEIGRINQVIKQLQAVEPSLTIKKILLTHGHIDHVGAAEALANEYQIEIKGPHKNDAFWLNELPRQAQECGMPPCAAFTPHHWLNDGDVITLGEELISVFLCPGHSPGHVVFFSKNTRLALVGDVLFNGSIGRTDFSQGNYDHLMASIKNKLWPLGDDVSFISGHGPMSTFGHERMYNPFVGQQA